MTSRVGVGTRWRVRRRHPLLLALVLALAVCVQASASGSPAPLQLLDGASMGGYPIGGSSPRGITVRFIDQGTFWVALLVRNRSSQPVTLLGARTPEPRNSLVAQTRAGFSRFTPCSGNRLCLWPSSPTSTKPLTLPPHTEAAVKLSYELVACGRAPASTSETGRALILTYRVSHGATRRESVALAGATLHLQRPAGMECLPRPFSHIGLVGSFTTSPGHQPVPGSTGDTCRPTDAGGLVFRSRDFLDRSGTEFWIEITLAHYHGVGSYTGHVTAVGGFGLHGSTTFHHVGPVAVISAEGTSITGRFTAVFSGHRRFFRAYGAWRCTTRR